MNTPHPCPTLLPDEFEEYYWKCSDHKYEQSDTEKMYCKLYTRYDLNNGVRERVIAGLEHISELYPKRDYNIEEPAGRIARELLALLAGDEK